MKTRITEERLTGERLPTYFLDCLDSLGWKNHSSHKTRHEAEKERARIACAHIQPQRGVSITNKEST